MFIMKFNPTDAKKSVFLKDENGNTIECLYNGNLGTINKKRDANSLKSKKNQHPLSTTLIEYVNNNVTHNSTNKNVNNKSNDKLSDESSDINSCLENIGQLKAEFIIKFLGSIPIKN